MSPAAAPPAEPPALPPLPPVVPLIVVDPLAVPRVGSLALARGVAPTPLVALGAPGVDVDGVLVVMPLNPAPDVAVAPVVEPAGGVITVTGDVGAVVEGVTVTPPPARAGAVVPSGNTQTTSRFEQKSGMLVRSVEVSAANAA